MTRKQFITNVLSLLEQSPCTDLRLSDQWHISIVLLWSNSREGEEYWTEFYKRLVRWHGGTNFMKVDNISHLLDMINSYLLIPEKERITITSMILSSRADRVMAVHILQHYLTQQDPSELEKEI